MAWTWRLETTDGTALDEPDSPAHQNQSDAETWLGEQFRDLSAAGVAAVTLFDGEAKVYGPMPLDPA